MVERISIGRIAFNVLNYTFLIAFAVACFLPLVNILAISFSDKTAAAGGLVGFWPVNFTTKSYQFVFQRQEFFNSFWIAIERVLLGTSINMIMTVIVAYPLSKEQREFPGRTIYAWIFVITILFSGGLIPWYITIKETGLLDSIWALVLPGAVPVFNCILLLNFFRGLPKALEEAAFVDGASHWTTLWRIFIPLSMPALATILLFSMVGHWNAWFDGLILMNSPDHYPLQSYLQTLVKMEASAFANMDPSQALLIADISDRSIKSAHIFMAAIPILIVYPFLQRYFMTGIVLGSVKE
jgi:putative aldouronate transport system permease protein